jgi:UDPglucose 6-dehydrogenase
MKIAVVGAGYVGLVTGTCFADSGNQVVCLDVDKKKIESLCAGEVPIYEPGLAELAQRNAALGRLRFTTDVAVAIEPAQVIYLTVGTPQHDDGSADLSALWQVVEQIAPYLAPDAIVVTKSTVPVGTNAQVAAQLRELTGRECQVASNPEFLKEGAAIEDFTKPDRVVVGVRRPEVAQVLRRLYAPFLRTDKPFLVMSPESAELTKYVANALLATKISFINQMANLCEKFDADINDVRRGIGHDSRIGFAFLFPGVGYGGSCFPKDVRAMIHTFHEAGIPPRILEAVDQVNVEQKHVLLGKMEAHFDGELTGKTIAIWGLAFKPRTDDIREAPALTLIDCLLALGSRLRVHDPVAMENVRKLYGERLAYCEQPADALAGADALAILTEWTEFRTPDFHQMRERMARPVIFDGRNLYDPVQMQEEGFTYYSIGRPPVLAAGPKAR